MNKFDEFQNTQLNSFLSHESQLKQAFEAGQQQYKSIVKAVDPDNLPEGEVLAFSDGRMLVDSKLYIEDHLFYGEDCGVWAVFYDEFNPTEDTHLRNITHYIETKDIIKMMEGL